MGVACMNVVRAPRTAWGSPLVWICGSTPPFQPEHHVGGLGLKHVGEVGAQCGGARFEAGSLVGVTQAVELGFEQFERGGDRDIKVAAGFEELLAIG